MGPLSCGEPDAVVLLFETDMPNELLTLYLPPPEPARCPPWLLTP